MKIDHIKPAVNQEAVFMMLGCTENDLLRSEMTVVYEELLPEVLERAKCSCIFDMAVIQDEDAAENCPAGTWVIYAIATAGRELSSLSAEYFAAGEYVKGMMADAMADSILFEMETQWMQNLKSFCQWKKIGISRRLEAPYDLPASVQKTAFLHLRAKELLGMEITSAYMYDPVKSSCVVFVVSEDSCQFHAGHDCRTCPAVNCRMRRVSDETFVKITVMSQGKQQEFRCKEQESILSAYQRQIGSGTAVCGGKGICGKCRIRIVSGELPVTDSDRHIFKDRELQEGYRLACRAYPKQDCIIELKFTDECDFAVVETFAGTGQEVSPHSRQGCSQPNMDPAVQARFGIALDIGTTTLAAHLVDLSNGAILASASAMNRQRRFGADVVSRIEAAGHGKAEQLRQLIQSDVGKLVKTLLKKADISADLVDKMVIAGNTTMGHLLMGYSCEGLGAYPFVPVNIGTICGMYQQIIGSRELDCEVCLLPGISAYVGGDIVSGLYACDFEHDEAINLFVDLGTNGEMALGNCRKLLTASAAAGPAFEGGNISCGTGSIPGAISHVAFGENGRLSIETIQNQTPTGICGTGVIELTSELLKAGFIDKTGLLAADYFEEGYPVAITPDGNEITFTQEDIREVQLAKSAVRAGIEILIGQFGITCHEIGHVYLAGGMGFQLDRDAAVTIGLLPEVLKEKITAVGNSSLAGAVRALTDPSWRDSVEKLASASEHVVLANHSDFNEYYVKYMMFE